MAVLGAVMSTGFWLVVALASGVLAIVLLGVVFAGPDRGIERRVQARLGSYGRAVAPTGRFAWLRRFSAGAERAAERGGLLRGIDSVLETSNVPVSAGEAVLGGIAVATLVGLVSALALESIVAGVVIAALMVVLLIVAVKEAAGRERRRFEAQLPDTLNLIATSLRAGYSLLQSVEAVAEQAPQPTAREFGRAVSEVRLGRAVPEALHGVADRVESIDFDWAVMAMEIQREIGGNLAEILTSASATLVARTRLRREVRALTAEGRLTAIVLVALPFGLFAYIWTVNRDYIQALLDATIGLVALGGAAILMGVGIFWLRRIIDVEV